MNQILKSGIVYTIGGALSSAIPFFLLPIFTKVLPTEEYGLIIQFFTIVAFLGCISGLSLHGAVFVKWSSSSEDKEIFTGNAIILILISIFLSIVFVIKSSSYFDYGLPNNLLFLAILYAGLNAIFFIRFYVYQCNDKPISAVLFSLTNIVINLSLSICLVISLKYGGVGRIIAVLITSILMSIFSIISLLKSKSIIFKFSLNNTKELLKFGIFLIPHSLAGAFLVNYDRIIVSQTMGYENLGVYGVAAQLGLIMFVISDSLNKAYQPKFISLILKSDLNSKLISVGIIYSSVFFWIIILFLIYFFIKIGGEWFIGQNYIKAIGLSLYFIVAWYFNALYQNFAAFFFTFNKTHYLSICSLISFLVVIFIGDNLVENYGLIGGALLVIISQLTILIVTCFFTVLLFDLPWTSIRLSFSSFFKLIKKTSE